MPLKESSSQGKVFVARVEEKLEFAVDGEGERRVLSGNDHFLLIVYEASRLERRAGECHRPSLPSMSAANEWRHV